MVNQSTPVCYGWFSPKAFLATGKMYRYVYRRRSFFVTEASSSPLYIPPLEDAERRGIDGIVGFYSDSFTEKKTLALASSTPLATSAVLASSTRLATSAAQMEIHAEAFDEVGVTQASDVAVVPTAALAASLEECTLNEAPEEVEVTHDSNVSMLGFSRGKCTLHEAMANVGSGSI